MQSLPAMGLHPSANNFLSKNSLLSSYKKKFGLSAKPSGSFVENGTGKDAKSMRKT